ncbi:MAG TPA: class I SAM-dependent methyltransferase [Acidimicrobiales bacterium]|nr:class I SAM-dependent methyltransferase [Acidimicrobiales bacterium]
MRRDLPPSTIYSEDYFLSKACEGLDEYLVGQISLVKQHEFDYLDVRPGDLVLDLGSGRGESSAEILRRRATPIALDYSAAAVRLTHQQLGHRSMVVRADALHMPFPDNSFDRVLMGDVIEHLPWALGVVALREVERVLVTGGLAIVHTSPNTWFITVVMRPLRLVLKILGRYEVLFRFDEYDRLRHVMHPNELSPRTIRVLMREAGVEAETWVDRDVLRSGSSEWTQVLGQSGLVRLLGRVAGLWPLRLLFGNDLYARITAG